MAQEPTQEQIKKFWEWCGLKHPTEKESPWASKPEEWWLYPNNPHYALPEPPRLDLNNLFKYAVPKLPANEIEFFTNNGLWTAVLWIPKVRTDPDGIRCSYREPLKATHQSDPALVLFWAIWEIIESPKETIAPTEHKK